MERQQQIKKILIILVVIGLFGLSYYYYGVRAPKTALMTAKNTVETKTQKDKGKLTQATAASSSAKNTKKTASKSAETQPVNNGQKESEEEIPSNANKKIKPTNKSSLISAALSSTGKADPFAHGRNSFAAYSGGSSLQNYAPYSDLPGLSELPPPPGFDGAEVSPEERVQIKGFLGDKVIAEINGVTEALAAGEKLDGVKVLSVDAAKYESSFLIDGKTVSKKLPPITSSNAELKYYDSLPLVENL
ncbi:MAG: hypothetical protein GX568_06045 [Candidatus Gastranaerophilales bacterium]|nr:hypothetical protein [Candidatus Gastranaerophilales bacterium]